MSVTVRPYVNGGWEVDIRVQLPDGSVIRERKKAAASSKQAAQKWAESRERVLLVHGKPKPVKEDVQKIPTLKEFALRFLDGYAKANRLKPSGIASKETVLRVHLAKAFGDKRLDEISTEDVQRLKAALTERAPKTVNNVLTVLSVVLRTAVEWRDRAPQAKLRHRSQHCDLARTFLHRRASWGECRHGGEALSGSWLELERQPQVSARHFAKLEGGRT